LDIVTTLSVNREFDETGTIENLPGSDRPSTVLSEEMVTNSPRLSIQQGAAQAGISKGSY
jgi:hypothetical protein